MSEDTRTQSNRQVGISTALSDDELVLISLQGAEALGRLFSYELELVSSEATPVLAKNILGTAVTVRLKIEENTDRYFNGIVSRFVMTSVDQMRGGALFYTYRATIVPWTWKLTRNATCRIFQNQTVPDIIKSIFATYSSDLETNLTETYRTWEYCVQYRETDFNFVSRLMEQEGIYYYFKHADGKHTMVLCDAPTAHESVKYYGTLQFDDPDGKEDDTYVWNWTFGKEILPDKYTLTDYNPLQPAANLKQSLSAASTEGTSIQEYFDYPGVYTAVSEGTFYTRTRKEELEAQYEISQASSSARGIFAGAIFALADHPIDDLNKGYLIIAASYSLQNDDVATHMKSRGKVTFNANITTMPAHVPFRPARLTPKPVVHGPQTALVVGKSGEEIWTDQYGRIKCKFYWDVTAEASDETSSCWMRVMQPWSGSSWGMQFIPRMGMEVVVTFLEGDPDRPLVTGSVYNATNMPPYALPDNKTQSGVRTRSTLQGAVSNCNEITFEDKKGSELFTLHAEKDMTRVVENDDSLTVGSSNSDTCPDGSQTISIYKDRTESVETGNETITIKKGNRSITVSEGNDSHEVTKGTRTVTVQGNDTHEIKQGNREVDVDTGNDTLNVKTGTRTVTVKGDDSYTVSTGDRSVTVSTGNDTHEVKTGNITQTADMGNISVEAKMGTYSLKCDLGTVTVEAMGGITLKCGENSIKIDATGVTINGMMVSIEGSLSAEVKGLMASVKGDAMMQAGGGAVMIG